MVPNPFSLTITIGLQNYSTVSTVTATMKVVVTDICATTTITGLSVSSGIVSNAGYGNTDTADLTI